MICTIGSWQPKYWCVVAQADALDEQTTKVKKLRDDLAQKDVRTRGQLEEQIAKESSTLTGMQVQNFQHLAN